jgi:CTP synthase
VPKYIFVTGGVLSGLGKGVSTASIAKLLQLSGYQVTCIKIDPYLNVDAGTMNPLIHGEVFVTDDGGETDMDLGTYERFLDVNLTREHNITTGQIYLQVIEAERRGEYLGRCVQIIPHITDAIKERIRAVVAKSGADIAIVECGGTVGDIEGLPFLEAFRQMRLEEGAENTLFVHVTLAPMLKPVGELKTKPTQHSVQELRRIGIQPDIVLVRSSIPLTEEARRKISLFTNVEYDCVISAPDTRSIYEVPEQLHGQGLVRVVARKLGLPGREPRLEGWRRTVRPYTEAQEEVAVAMVGKYVELADSYVSVNHALIHAAGALGLRVRIVHVDSEAFESRVDALQELQAYDAILIPGGFGPRGSEGKVLAANFARVHGIPYLGLCFGFQMAVVSFARYACGLEGANSTELDPDTPHPVIDLLPEQKEIEELGGTMRLGGHDIVLVEGSLAHRIYGTTRIRERHRHRYELNQKYLELFRRHGLHFTGFSDNGRRAEILEIPDHPFYLATQYHPEFISRPGRPEPAYRAFIEAALARRRRREAIQTVR